MDKIRVLVVDDSALMRKMIPIILESDSRIEVVDTAMDGIFALEKIEKTMPDVITLDLDMPRLGGVDTLRRIVNGYGIPTVIVSSLSRSKASITIQALQVGAFDFVTKPQNAISVHITEIGRELIAKVKAAYDSPVSRLRVRKVQTEAIENSFAGPAKVRRSASRVLAIGASTGGPNALSYLLPRIPGDFPAGILIAQHMPEEFTEMFATRLNSICELEVREAREGDLVYPGRVLIAPGNRHLKVRRMPNASIAVISDSQEVNGHRPSVDVLFNSVAAEFGGCCTALLMTGMGSDGAEGLGEIKRRGGYTMAQDEDSSIVYGMPKAAVDRGYAMSVLPLDEIAGYLVKEFMEKEDAYVAGNC